MLVRSGSVQSHFRDPTFSRTSRSVANETGRDQVEAKHRSFCKIEYAYKEKKKKIQITINISLNLIYFNISLVNFISVRIYMKQETVLQRLHL